MSENIKVENWCDYDIRFVEHEGSWYAVIKDICDAQNRVRTFGEISDYYGL